MRSDTILPSLFASLAVHSLLLVIIFVAVNYSKTYSTPAPYIVSLVPSESPFGPGEVKRIDKPTEPRRERTAKPEPRVKPENNVAIPDKSRITERIAAMQAKKQIQRIVEIRRHLDIRRRGTQQPQHPVTGTAAPSGGSAEYEALVINRIHDFWTLPEHIDKDLLAVIHIRIARNGMVSVEKFERKSGNPLFDRAALRALTASSPLPAPPREMDFAVRFQP